MANLISNPILQFFLRVCKFLSIFCNPRAKTPIGTAYNSEVSNSLFLDDLVVALDEKIENTAIAMRRTIRMKLPDAIVAATAISLEATLITGDHQFRNLGWPGLHVAMPT